MNSTNSSLNIEEKKKSGFKAVFVDRDGTLVRDIPHAPNDLRYYDLNLKTIELLKDYFSKGYIIIIITNQACIGKGLCSYDDYYRFTKRLIKDMQKHGLQVAGVYYCPHRKEENCKCRKPNTGLIEAALEDWNIDLKNSILIGDRDDIDGELARRLGIKFINIGGEIND